MFFNWISSVEDCKLCEGKRVLETRKERVDFRLGSSSEIMRKQVDATVGKKEKNVNGG